MRKLKWILLAFGLLILGTGSYYAYSFYNFATHISDQGGGHVLTNKSVSEVGKAYMPPKWEGQQRVNILLLGGDSRGLDPSDLPRSDSIMVASIDPVSKKAHLFSILRDTYVKIPDNGEDRINAAITTGGPNLAMKTVSDLLGIPIQYYVYTDFKGFMALVDSIGGIDFEVEKDMKWSDSEDNHLYDINLKKGMQHLDGKTALQYVRFRHDAMSDFTRTERQRNFLKAVASKLQTTSSIVKLPRILNAVDPYIETNLSINNMLKLASLGFEAKSDGIVSAQLPPTELLDVKTIRGAEVITTNKNKLQLYVRDLLDGNIADPGASPSPAPRAAPKAVKK
jgi:polyisoprenyl-teichoic acid--peptidoglycan teichoic acid transferase